MGFIFDNLNTVHLYLTDLGKLKFLDGGLKNSIKKFSAIDSFNYHVFKPNTIDIKEYSEFNIYEYGEKVKYENNYYKLISFNNNPPAPTDSLNVDWLQIYPYEQSNINSQHIDGFKHYNSNLTSRPFNNGVKYFDDYPNQIPLSGTFNNKGVLKTNKITQRNYVLFEPDPINKGILSYVKDDTLLGATPFTLSVNVVPPECDSTLEDWFYSFLLDGGEVYEYSLDDGETWDLVDGNTLDINLPSYTGETTNYVKIIFREYDEDDPEEYFIIEYFMNNSPVNPITVSLVTSVTNPLCYNELGSITVQASGGVVGSPNTYEYALVTIVDFIESVGQYQKSSTFNNLPAGEYNVLAKKINTNCDPATLDETIIITIPDPVFGDVVDIQNPITCDGADGSITIFVSGGTGEYYFSLNGGISYNSTPITPINDNIIINDVPSGNYSIVIKDSNNCIMFNPPIPVTIIATESPNINLVYTPPNCNGGDATITLTGSGGTPPYQFSSDGINFQFSGVFVLPPYTEPRTYHIVDSNSCTNSITMVGLGQPELLAGAGDYIKPNCYSEPSELATINLFGFGGVPPYTFSEDQVNWFTENYLQLDPYTGNKTLYIKDSNGCTNEFNVEGLGEPSELTLFGEYLEPQCSGDFATVILSPTGGTDPYEFSANGVTYTSQNQLILSQYTGNKTFYVKDSGGCVDEVEIMGTGQPDLIGFSGQYTQPNCNGGQAQVELTVTGGVSPYQFSEVGFPYNWVAGDIFNLTPYTGNKTFYVKDDNDCIQQTVVVGTGQPTLLQLNLSVVNDSDIDINVIGGTSPYTITVYDSSDSFVASGTTDFVVTGLVSDIYTVEVIDDNGCEISDDIDIVGPSPLMYYFMYHLHIDAPPNPYFVQEIGDFRTFNLADESNIYLDSSDPTIQAPLETVVAAYINDLESFSGGSIDIYNQRPSGWTTTPLVLNMPPIPWEDKNVAIMVPVDSLYSDLTVGAKLKEPSTFNFPATYKIEVEYNNVNYYLYVVYNVRQNGSGGKILEITS